MKNKETVFSYEQLEMFIPRGAGKAISMKALSHSMGLSERQTREEIASHRRAGRLILSSTGKKSGYFLPLHVSDVRMFVKEQKARALSSLEALKAAESWLKDQEQSAVYAGLDQMTIADFMRDN